MSEEKFPCLNCGTEINKSERRLSEPSSKLYDRCSYCIELKKELEVKEE